MLYCCSKTQEPFIDFGAQSRYHLWTLRHNFTIFIYIYLYTPIFIDFRTRTHNRHIYRLTTPKSKCTL